jgi:hypothetical protein
MLYIRCPDAQHLAAGSGTPCFDLDRVGRLDGL